MHLTYRKLKLLVSLTGFLLLFSPATALSDPLLYDDFDGTALDASVWNIVYDFGTIEVSGGTLTTFGTTEAPGYKRIDSFSAFQPMGDTLVASARAGAEQAEGSSRLFHRIPCPDRCVIYGDVCQLRAKRAEGFQVIERKAFKILRRAPMADKFPRLTA